LTCARRVTCRIPFLLNAPCGSFPKRPGAAAARLSTSLLSIGTILEFLLSCQCLRGVPFVKGHAALSERAGSPDHEIEQVQSTFGSKACRKAPRYAGLIFIGRAQPCLWSKNTMIPASRFPHGVLVTHRLQPVLGVRPGLFKPASAGLLGQGL